MPALSIELRLIDVPVEIERRAEPVVGLVDLGVADRRVALGANLRAGQRTAVVGVVDQPLLVRKQRRQRRREARTRNVGRDPLGAQRRVGRQCV